MNRGEGDYDMVYGDGLTTREEKDSRLFFSQHQPNGICWHSKIRHRPQQKINNTTFYPCGICGNAYN